MLFEIYTSVQSCLKSSRMCPYPRPSLAQWLVEVLVVVVVMVVMVVMVMVLGMDVEVDHYRIRF